MTFWRNTFHLLFQKVSCYSIQYRLKMCNPAANAGLHTSLRIVFLNRRWSFGKPDHRVTHWQYALLRTWSERTNRRLLIIDYLGRKCRSSYRIILPNQLRRPELELWKNPDMCHMSLIDKVHAREEDHLSSFFWSWTAFTSSSHTQLTVAPAIFWTSPLIETGNLTSCINYCQWHLVQQKLCSMWIFT